MTKQTVMKISNHVSSLSYRKIIQRIVKASCQLWPVVCKLKNNLHLKIISFVSEMYFQQVGPKLIEVRRRISVI